jgi:uncharacterized protein YdiU (UPF0061 family)
MLNYQVLMPNIDPTESYLRGFRFDNRFVRELPGDANGENERRQVHGACYSRVNPVRFRAPELVAYSREMAASLGLGEMDGYNPGELELFTEVFSGNRVLADTDPFAMCYGGHQFGNWAGQLGDGRAINLGEVVNPVGRRWVLQLKGAGPTPYSRMADGLAVLRSSVREFLCSEAMHHLGVPTTRALSLILTGEQVVRDMFYDGNPKKEPGAVVCRVSPSFIRFGNFEIFSSRRDIALLKRFADYTIRTDFPHLGEPNESVYVAWFEEVCRTTMELIVHWMRVGFVHGVMNTDNMSILGLTIDYGPYGWLEDFDLNWTPNTTDAQGRRYGFGNQPSIAMWNLVQLAKAIYPLIEQEEPLQNAINAFADDYAIHWGKMLTSKLGLVEYRDKDDEWLIKEQIAILQSVETDMTTFYRNLAKVDTSTANTDNVDDKTLMAPLADAYYLSEQITDSYQQRLGKWLRLYLKRVNQEGVDPAQRISRMNSINPKYVLRNYLAQLAIDKSEQGDH